MKNLILIIAISAGLTLISINLLKGKESMNNKNSQQAEAIFAGGCFWCMEPPFEQLEGVKSVTSGYTGGKTINPDYRSVSSGNTGHYEAIRVIYDTGVVTYETLLKTFWQNIDPTDEGGQFNDRGSQYFTAIFYKNQEQKMLAQESKKNLEDSGKFDRPIVTEILPAAEFYESEEYHQNYYLKQPDHYKRYKKGSGREDFIKNTWENQENTRQVKPLKNSRMELKKRLTPMQYNVTQENGTEPPFKNEYWNNKAEGIYIDLISGEVLFSSKDKYDSGSGWPCFSKTVDETELVTKMDWSHNMVRTEVRAAESDSHLGHLFDDNMSSTGKRYCINSAALDFIPKDQMEQRGYGEYLKIFK